MKRKKEKERRIGGLLLEVVMIVFIFCYSFAGSSIKTPSRSEALVWQTTPSVQIVFQDPNSSESLVPFLSKIQITLCDFVHALVDQQGRKVAICTSFSVAQHAYNTFYKHITIHAP